MSTHNIGFYEDLTKLSLNYHQISSNTLLISSAADILYYLGIYCHNDGRHITKTCLCNMQRFSKV